MGSEQQCVISDDNAYSADRVDRLAYDLRPSCLILAQPQEFSIPKRNIDMLIFLITQVLKNNDIRHRVLLTDHWAISSPIESPK